MCCRETVDVDVQRKKEGRKVGEGKAVWVGVKEYFGQELREGNWGMGRGAKGAAGVGGIKGCENGILRSDAIG